LTAHRLPFNATAQLTPFIPSKPELGYVPAIISYDYYGVKYINNLHFIPDAPKSLHHKPFFNLDTYLIFLVGHQCGNVHILHHCICHLHNCQYRNIDKNYKIKKDRQFDFIQKDGTSLVYHFSLDVRHIDCCYALPDKLNGNGRLSNDSVVEIQKIIKLIR
jgi:hypothetical protein